MKQLHTSQEFTRRPPMSPARHTQQIPRSHCSYAGRPATLTKSNNSSNCCIKLHCSILWSRGSTSRGEREREIRLHLQAMAAKLTKNIKTLPATSQLGFGATNYIGLGIGLKHGGYLSRLGVYHMLIKMGELVADKTIPWVTYEPS